MICRNRDESIVACKSKERVITSQGKPAVRPVVFLFPGQGAQYAKIGAICMFLNLFSATRSTVVQRSSRGPVEWTSVK